MSEYHLLFLEELKEVGITVEQELEARCFLKDALDDEEILDHLYKNTADFYEDLNEDEVEGIVENVLSEIVLGIVNISKKV